MRKLALLVALSIAVPAAFGQTVVSPLGKNLTNPQSPSNPQCVELDTAGLATSASNPQPVQLSQGNAVLSDTNTLPVRLNTGSAALNGAVPSAANALPVALGPSALSTYSATTAFQTPVATPTDIVGIIGSASKTVKIQRIVLNSTQTTAGINKWFLAKRSTANTGSTVVNPTVVPHDSGNAAGTAVVKQYTVTNPSTGTLVGNVLTASALSPAPGATAIGGQQVIFDAKLSGQPIVLRGVAQELDLNFAGAAVPAGLDMSVNIEWTEE